MSDATLNGKRVHLVSSASEVVDVTGWGSLNSHRVVGATTLVLHAPGREFLPGQRVTVGYLGHEASGWVTGLETGHAHAFMGYGDLVTVTLDSEWVEQPEAQP